MKSETTADAISGETLDPGNPFKGLEPYGPEDQQSFFGRDQDLLLILDRIYLGRTTLLFAGSGVGKTSFLRALVCPHLSADMEVIFHNRWSEGLSPLDAVRSSISTALRLSDSDQPLPALLSRFRKPAVSPSTTRQPWEDPPVPAHKGCCIVLDQFEELFQFRSGDATLRLFIEELCSLVNDETLSLHIIVSTREEFLGELSIFQNRIPDLFANYYHLRYPNKQQATDIIRKTCETRGASVNEANLALLIKDLSTVERGAATTLERAVSATATQPGSIERDFVIPPYLQIACRRLWQKQSGKKDGEAAAAFVFLNEYHAGEAIQTLEEFCDRQLKNLDRRGRYVAFRAFDFLVTKQGAKMAYEMKSLVKHSGIKVRKLERVLKNLSAPNTRILRESKGPDGSSWFELYHDIYGTILDRWKERYHIERRNFLAMTTTGAALAATAVVLGFLFLYWIPLQHVRVLQRSDVSYADAQGAYQKLSNTLFFSHRSKQRWAEYWDRRAFAAELEEKRIEALRFRLEALAANETDTRRRLVSGLLAPGEARLQMTFPTEGNLRLGLFSQDGAEVLTESENGLIRIWSTSNGAPLTPPLYLQTEFPGTSSDRGALPDITSFARDRQTGFLVGGTLNGTPRVWRTDNGRALDSFIRDLQSNAPARTGSLPVPYLPPGSEPTVLLNVDGTFTAVIEPSSGKATLVGLQNRAVRTFAVPKVDNYYRSPGQRTLLPAAFTSDGQQLAVLGLSGRMLQLWPLMGDRPSLGVSFPEKVYAFCLGSDGDTVFVDHGGTFRVWRLSTGKPTGPVFNAPLGVLAGITQNGRQLLSGFSFIEGLAVTDSSSGMTSFAFGDFGTSLSRIMDFAPASNAALIAPLEGPAPGGTQLLRLDLDSSHPLTPEQGVLVHLAMSQNGQRLMRVTLPGFEEGAVPKVHVDEINSKKTLLRDIPAEFGPTSVLSPDGTLVAVPNTSSVSLRRVGTEDAVSVDLVPDRIPLSGNTGSFSAKSKFAFQAMPAFETSPAPYSQGVRQNIVVLDLEARSHKQFSVVGRLIGFSLDPSGQYLSASWEQNLTSVFTVWDLNNDTSWELDAGSVVSAYGLQGYWFGRKYLAYPTGKEIRLIDPSTHSVVMRLQADVGIQAVHMSDDETKVAALGIDNKLYIWPSLGHAAHVAFPANGGVSRMQFTDNGTAFVYWTRSGWAHRLVRRGDVFVPDGNLFVGRSDLTGLVDSAGKTIRVVQAVQPQGVNTSDITFDRMSFPPIQGDPRQLLENWSRRLGLEQGINKDGQLVFIGSKDPILRPEIAPAPDPRQSTPGRDSSVQRPNPDPR